MTDHRSLVNAYAFDLDYVYLHMDLNVKVSFVFSLP